MQNGIIINGVKYEATPPANLGSCSGCAFQGSVLRKDFGYCQKGKPCEAFSPYDVIFVKLKEEKK